MRSTLDQYPAVLSLHRRRCHTRPAVITPAPMIVAPAMTISNAPEGCAAATESTLRARVSGESVATNIVGLGCAEGVALGRGVVVCTGVMLGSIIRAATKATGVSNGGGVGLLSGVTMAIVAAATSGACVGA